MFIRTPFPASVDDYRARARARLPRFLFDYVDGGAVSEQTLRDNENAWQNRLLPQNVLRAVEHIDTRTTVVDQSLAIPVVLAPIGMAGMMATRGEVQAVRAANALGIPFTLSTVGICSLQEINAAATQPFWFQLYMMRDRALVSELLQRAWDNGCTTLMFTVDLPRAGLRRRDIRNGLNGDQNRARWLRLQQLLSRPHWLWHVGINGKPHRFGCLGHAVPEARDLNGFKSWIDAQFDANVTWNDIAWLRSQWRGKLIIKGVLNVADAIAAQRSGADAIVVSNHGGRQSDGVAATADVLPAIAAAVAAHCDVLVDGGVRSGVDVFRALALGARAVLIGRPWVWAMAADGERGIINLLTQWQQELSLAMRFSGINRIDAIAREHVLTK